MDWAPRDTVPFPSRERPTSPSDKSRTRLHLSDNPIVQRLGAWIDAQPVGFPPEAATVGGLLMGLELAIQDPNNARRLLDDIVATASSSPPTSETGESLVTKIARKIRTGEG